MKTCQYDLLDIAKLFSFILDSCYNFLCFHV
jgi:hypothetical protein